MTKSSTTIRLYVCSTLIIWFVIRDVLFSLQTLSKVRKVWRSAQLCMTLYAKCCKCLEWPENLATHTVFSKKLKSAIYFVFWCLVGKLLR